MAFNVENGSGATLEISDIGITLDVGEITDLSTRSDPQSVAISVIPGNEIHTLITNGDLIIKDPADGTTNLSVANGISAVTSVNTPGAYFAENAAAGSDLEIQDEGISLSTAAVKINFAGAGVTATEPVADEILVTIPGNAGGQIASETVAFAALTVVTITTIDVYVDVPGATMDITTTETGFIHAWAQFNGLAPGGNTMFNCRLVIGGIGDDPVALRLEAANKRDMHVQGRSSTALTAGTYTVKMQVANLDDTGNASVEQFMMFASSLGAPAGADGAAGPPGSGSTIILEEGGIPVTNTPHDTIDFSSTDFIVTDNADGSATIDLTEAGSGATVQLDWRFSTTTTAADPGNRNFRYNNATLASVTNIYVNDTANNGIDAGFILSTLETGDEIYIQQSDDSLSNVLFELSGTPTDNIGWWTIPVTVKDSGILHTNNKNCGWLLLFSGGGGGGGNAVDRQSIITATNFSTTSGTDVDVTSTTLTTKDLGGVGDYIISFSCEYHIGKNDQAAIFSVTVGGTPEVAMKAVGLEDKGNNWLNFSMTHLAPDVASGTIIKIQARVEGDTLEVETRELVINGVLSTDVLP